LSARLKPCPDTWIRRIRDFKYVRRPRFFALQVTFLLL
jgi:hypothetical protein